MCGIAWLYKTAVVVATVFNTSTGYLRATYHGSQVIIVTVPA